MKLIDQIKKFTLSSENMTSIADTEKLPEKVADLKEEFDRKYSENEVSGSSEQLKEYKFLAILGQGAFGLVVIYHFPSFSTSFFMSKSHRNS